MWQSFERESTLLIHARCRWCRSRGDPIMPAPGRVRNCDIGSEDEESIPAALAGRQITIPSTRRDLTFFCSVLCARNPPAARVSNKIVLIRSAARPNWSGAGGSRPSASFPWSSSKRDLLPLNRRVHLRPLASKPCSILRDRHSTTAISAGRKLCPGAAVPKVSSALSRGCQSRPRWTNRFFLGSAELDGVLFRLDAVIGSYREAGTRTVGV